MGSIGQAVDAWVLGLPGWLVLVVAFALPALESGALVGFVFPGETALVLGGVVAAEGRVPVVAVMVAGVLGAVIGDACGYLLGRRYGVRVLERVPPRLLPPRHVARASAYLKEKGGLAVFLGRFTATLRVLVPGLAGMAEMPYRRFALANVSGGSLWAVGSVLLGFVGGHAWRQLTGTASHVALVVVAAVVVALVSHHLWVSRAARR